MRKTERAHCQTRTTQLLLVIGLVCLITSCNQNETRTQDDIFSDRMSLPRLYMTYPDLRRVTAEKGLGAWVEESTGEVFWPARACDAPDCPGRSVDGTPYLFVTPQPQIFGAAPNQPAQLTGMAATGGCPECTKIPGLGETQLRQRRIQWVRPYVLPETAKRLAELDVERKILADRKRGR